MTNQNLLETVFSHPKIYQATTITNSNERRKQRKKVENCLKVSTHNKVDNSRIPIFVVFFFYIIPLLVLS